MASLSVQCGRVRVWPFGLCPVTLGVETVSSVCCNWDPSEMEKIQSVTRVDSYWWCVFSRHQDQGFTLQVPWLWSLGAGSTEGRHFAGERVALLGAPPDPWVCHIKALKSKLGDNQVKCRELSFPCKWYCSQGAKAFLKFMLGRAWWKWRYVFITGGEGGSNDHVFVFSESQFQLLRPARESTFKYF